MKKITAVLSGATVFLVILAGWANNISAQSYTPLAPLPGTFDTVTGKTDMATYIPGAVKLIIALGGAIAILIAIVGAMQYIASGIAPDAKNSAKNRMQNAIVGLLLILFSYLILNTINPALVGNSLVLAPVGTTPVSGAPWAGPALIIPPAPPSILFSPTPHPPAPPTIIVPSIPAVPFSSTTPPVGMDITNDYSILSKCLNNTTYTLCANTDLNSDGVTDTVDIALFINHGYPLDLNGNKILELAVLPKPVSCFIKEATATNIGPPLVDNQWTFDPYGVINKWYCGGGPFHHQPTLKCNNKTWFKYSDMDSVCAVDNGLATMPFSVPLISGPLHPGPNGIAPGVAGEDGEYENFKIWIKNSSSGKRVDLIKLFQWTYLNAPSWTGGPYGQALDPYHESALGKLTYATISQYDLNDDGFADFNLGGSDIAVFNGCIGQPLSGACAQADFNGNGKVESNDIKEGKLGFFNSIYDVVKNYIFGSGPFVPFNFKVLDFEGLFFDPAGYTDKQIITYCIGQKTWFITCGPANLVHPAVINPNDVVDSADLAFYDTKATPLNFNGDNQVDLK